MANDKNRFGQYMTPEIVARFMVSLAELDKDSKILEPCCGEGVFLDIIKEKGFNNITAYEIDKSIIKPSYISFVKNRSFISDDIENKFDLIIGNPPYIRWKNLETELKDELSNNILWNKYCNSLCDYSSIFIIKSIELLKENGQLIFITPEYWLNTTNSITLRNYMIKKGYFVDIYHFNETPIFENAAVSTIIFKFVKSQNIKNNKIKIAKYYSTQKLNNSILINLKGRVQQEKTEYLNIPQFEKNQNWILAHADIIKELTLFEEKCKKPNINSNLTEVLSLFEEKTANPNSHELYLIKEFCDIGNGMVSGLDKAFQISNFDLNENENKHILKVVKAKNLVPFYHNEITNYLFIKDELLTEEQFQVLFPNFYKQLQPYKKLLNERYQYKQKANYWEWVFLRSFNLFNKEVERIFVPCKERISSKKYFRFAMVNKGIFPTQDVTAIFKKEETKESIFYILAFLNSKYVFDWLRHNGIVKGSIVEFSEKPIANIPFRKINFDLTAEVELHNLISKLTQRYIESKDISILEQIQINLDKLFI